MRARSVVPLSLLTVAVLALGMLPPEVKADEVSAKKWALLTLDVGLGMAAAIAVISHNEAAYEYNSLLKDLDNTTDQNYQILIIKEQDVDSKRRTATILGVSAVLAVGYTLADAFMFHQIFPESVSLRVVPTEAVLALKLRF